MNRTNARRFRALLAVGCCLAMHFLTQHASAVNPSAPHPQYWTIGRHQPGENVEAKHPQGYAYGWFGATGRPQASRQTGYYGIYRQWSFK